jgi:histidinol-phosphate aminotransferase
MSPEFPIRPFIRKMEGYTPGEQPGGMDLVKLNTNENPYPPSKAVVEEVKHALRRVRLYPNPICDSLRRALAAYHGVEPEQILVGNGSDEILRLLIHAIIGEGDKIAVVDPTYSLYPVLAAAYGGETTVYPLENLEKLPPELFTGPEKLLFLPNPNPPIGTLYSRAEVAQLCRGRAKGMVAIDEAYVDFAPRDVVPLLFEFPNLVITRTFSKSFSLAGMRVGYLIGHADFVAELMKIKDSYNVGMLPQMAAAAAIASVGDMQAKREIIVETRAKTTQYLRELGYRVPDSHGNFVFASHPDARAHFKVLRERGILVRWFNHPLLQDGIRISIGTPEQMVRVIECLKECVQGGTRTNESEKGN